MNRRVKLMCRLVHYDILLTTEQRNNSSSIVKSLSTLKSAIIIAAKQLYFMSLIVTIKLNLED